MKRLGSVALLLIGISGVAFANSRLRSVRGARLNLQRIAASFEHTCTIFDDGTVHCWGANDHGQLGDGSVSASKSLAVQATGVNSADSVAVGHRHSCALRWPGVVVCWGDNTLGQLGNGTFSSSPTAVQTTSLDNVKAIAAGGFHTCALRSDGTVWCWGDNSDGDLGVGSAAITFSSPVKAQLPLPAVAITAGTAHSCAVLVDGSARCWGLNSDYQLGDSTNTVRRVPVTVSDGGVALSNAVDIVAGSYHTCALRSTGTMSCWGRGSSGQLGYGQLGNRFFPNDLLPISSVVAIGTGDTHTCALFVSGDVTCWGDNTSGQLGTGNYNPQPSAINGVHPPGFSNGVELTAGSQYTCALDGHGIAQCWGRAVEGELGNGTSNSSTLPVTTTGVSGNIGARFLTSALDSNCAGRGSGVLSCWGAGDSGQLGNGSRVNAAPNPVNVATSVLQIGAVMGTRHACGLGADGTVHCWGDNNSGDVGNNSTTEQDSPVAVLNGVTALAAGGSHTCALRVDGSVRCWGNNFFGQVGGGSFGDSHIPIDASVDHVVGIAAAGLTSCALRDNGTVSCWGSGFFGALGNGSTGTTSRVPVPVSGLNNAIALTGGNGSFCALLANGGVDCWGQNDSGQLGNSNTQQRNVPDTVSGLQDAVAVDMGDDHACAVRAEGSAVCWGANSSGDLGAATADPSLVPVPVIARFATVNGLQIPIKLSFVVGISAGAAHTCALLAYGQPVCWGGNFSGEIGDGTLTTRPRPTAVNSYTANVAPVSNLETNGRFAVVTVLINCPAGGEAHVNLTLTQGAVFGTDSKVQACEGGLVQTPFTLSARGPLVFQPGAATAQVEALVKDSGETTQDQHWTRDVTLVPLP